MENHVREAFSVLVGVTHPDQLFLTAENATSVFQVTIIPFALQMSSARGSIEIRTLLLYLSCHCF